MPPKRKPSSAASGKGNKPAGKGNKPARKASTRKPVAKKKKRDEDEEAERKRRQEEDERQRAEMMKAKSGAFIKLFAESVNPELDEEVV